MLLLKKKKNPFFCYNLFTYHVTSWSLKLERSSVVSSMLFDLVGPVQAEGGTLSYKNIGQTYQSHLTMWFRIRIVCAFLKLNGKQFWIIFINPMLAEIEWRRWLGKCTGGRGEILIFQIMWSEAKQPSHTFIVASDFLTSSACSYGLLWSNTWRILCFSRYWHVLEISWDLYHQECQFQLHQSRNAEIHVTLWHPTNFGDRQWYSLQRTITPTILQIDWYHSAIFTSETSSVQWYCWEFCQVLQNSDQSEQYHERTATERYHEQLSFTIPMHSSQRYKKQSSKTFSWSRTTSWSQESQTASLFQEGQSSNVDIRSCDQDNRQSSFCYSW